MRFVVAGRGIDIEDLQNACLLVATGWDDWFRYETTHRLLYCDDAGRRTALGSVKIGQFEMGRGHERGEEDDRSLRRPQLPDDFDTLPSSRFFSVGQDADYYENVASLGAVLRDEILFALADLALSEGLLERAMREGVTTVSLFRELTRAAVEGQFRRIARGGAKLTDYHFKYLPYVDRRSTAPPLEFDVWPKSHPPTNIHVVIGRNGVGKTRMLHHMATALVSPQNSKAERGSFEFSTADGDAEAGGQSFTRLVSVSFSAFDALKPVHARRSAEYVYIGLQQKPDKDRPESSRPPKSNAALSREFSSSVLTCLRGERLVRWRRALKELESDPVFGDIGVAALADTEGEESELRAMWVALFSNRLSSGHKIVLLTITRLVENVEERSLVLLDEPEAHLHPPLLSAFIRALSDLLNNRNGAAIVATHSPVVLQEVPRSCVSIMRRSGRATSIDRPTLETFGENVSVLTHEVFGLEVTKSGFYRLLERVSEEADDYQEALNMFEGQLGGEARGILRGLDATRDEDH